MIPDASVQEILLLDGEQLTVRDVVEVARFGRNVRLSPGAEPAIRASYDWVRKVVEDGCPMVYGLNTGYGPFADVAIKPEETRVLSRNLILSHSCGVGTPLPEEVVRAAIVARANTLARGNSGIGVPALGLLIEMLNRGVTPWVPAKGSVGASGDLAPMCHIIRVMTTYEDGRDEESGSAWFQGKLMSGAEAMAAAGLERVVLGAKEGVALTNGSSVSVGMGCLAVWDAANLAKNAQVALAMSLEAMHGWIDAFHERANGFRKLSGQARLADNVRRLCLGSSLTREAGPGWTDGKPQDAYSLRCSPVVLGAVLDTIDHVWAAVESELNAPTDSPLIFPDLDRPNKALSVGNFHGGHVAMALDFLAIAVTELASISERRCFRLVDESLSLGLPAMLTRNGGLENGLMIVQYTAAALVSDSKTLSHPDSVDSIPTAANQEDHVSMAPNAARHALEVIQNAEYVVSIEMLCSAQGLDFRIEDSETGQEDQFQMGAGTRAAHRALRGVVAHNAVDGPLSDQITTIARLVRGGSIVEPVEAAVGALA